METILIFTNETELSEYDLGNFDVTIDSKQIELSVDSTKKIILVFDEIADTDIKILNALIPVGKVYILHHTNSSQDILINLKTELINKGINEESIHVKRSSHTDANTYGLIRNIGNCDNGKLNKAFESFKLAIAGDPYLESLIKLHKTLSISLISNPRISIQDLKNNDKYKLAFELLNGETNIEKILKETPSKILERSKS